MSSSLLDTSAGVLSRSAAMLFCFAISIELYCSQRSPSQTFYIKMRNSVTPNVKQELLINSLTLTGK
jgi:hypothetical protein